MGKKTNKIPADRFFSNTTLISKQNTIINAESESIVTKRKIVHASSKYIRGSPSKVRRVLDIIRGRKYDEALMILEFIPYRACEPILKCLLSAASNAKNNFNMKKNELYVNSANCDMGPIQKRYRPRAQGRGDSIKKQTSHITITLTTIS